MNTNSSSLRDQTHDSRNLTGRNWPIAAGLLQFPARKLDGTSVQESGYDDWLSTLGEVSEAGFDQVELTDTWLRVGDLSNAGLDSLRRAIKSVSMTVPAVALIRRSILEPGNEASNLAYSHRSIDAAAAIGAPVVSVGLHEPLTQRQREALWFWTERGASNDPKDLELWNNAVSGMRELGRHAAEVGVILSLEMYEDTYLGTADSAVRLVNEVEMSNVGLNPDIGNIIRLHRPIENWDEAFQKVLPYANYWHVKNYMRSECAQTGAYFASPTSLELGLINYRKVIRDAINFGFSGVITCEHYGGDGLSVSSTNRDYLRTILPIVNPAKGLQ